MENILKKKKKNIESEDNYYYKNSGGDPLESESYEPQGPTSGAKLQRKPIRIRQAASSWYAT